MSDAPRLTTHRGKMPSTNQGPVEAVRGHRYYSAIGLPTHASVSSGLDAGVSTGRDRAHGEDGLFANPRLPDRGVAKKVLVERCAGQKSLAQAH